MDQPDSAILQELISFCEEMDMQLINEYDANSQLLYDRIWIWTKKGEYLLEFNNSYKLQTLNRGLKALYLYTL